MSATKLTPEQTAEGQARDAATLERWEAERKARMLNNANTAVRGGMSAEQAVARYVGNWDAGMPSHIIQRHNLKGR